MPRTLFVSDAHLHPRSPEANRPFLSFLREECDALYLLGDVFDYWIGPKHLEGPDYRDEIAAIREKSARAKVYFLHGNRDYFVDEKFSRATGVTILGARARSELGGRRVHLDHGDSLYNRNPKYAAYRSLMRSKPLSDLWRAIPAAAGKTLARGFRGVSKKTSPPAVWSGEEVLDRAGTLFRQGVDVLVCGHIHAPMHVSGESGGRRCDVYVLGHWGEGGTRHYLRHDGRGFHFTRWA